MSSIQEINQTIAQADIKFRSKFPEFQLLLQNTTPLQFWISHQQKKFEEAFADLVENVPKNKIDNWIKHKLLNCVRTHFDVRTFEFDHDPIFKDFEEEIEQEYDNNMKCAHCPDGDMVVLPTGKLQCRKCGGSDIKHPDIFTISNICTCGGLLEQRSGKRVCLRCSLEDTRVFQGQKEYGQTISDGVIKSGKHGYYKETLNTFTTDNLKKNKTKEILKQKIYDYLYKNGIDEEEIEKIIRYYNDHSKIYTIKKIITLLIKKKIDFDENIFDVFGITPRQKAKLQLFLRTEKTMKDFLR